MQYIEMQMTGALYFVTVSQLNVYLDTPPCQQWLLYNVCNDRGHGLSTSAQVDLFQRRSVSSDTNILLSFLAV